MVRSVVGTSVMVSAAVHLYLWIDFARSDDILGPSFMLNAVAGALIAMALATSQHWIPELLAIGFGLSTLGAFILSTTVGLFGVTANWSGWAVWVCAAAEVLAVASSMWLLGARRFGRPRATA